eukprot:COSAG06_NODE_39633_length_410_cov_1.160772_1_plen_34_part_10
MGVLYNYTRSVPLASPMAASVATFSCWRYAHAYS